MARSRLSVKAQEAAESVAALGHAFATDGSEELAVQTFDTAAHLFDLAELL